jgi:hypothetical protein
MPSGASFTIGPSFPVAFATSILSSVEERIFGSKWSFAHAVTVRRALRKHPERSGGHRDYDTNAPTLRITSARTLKTPVALDGGVETGRTVWLICRRFWQRDKITMARTLVNGRLVPRRRWSEIAQRLALAVSGRDETQLENSINSRPKKAQKSRRINLLAARVVGRRPSGS